MWLMYLIALVPVMVFAYLWATNKKVVFWEFAVSALIGIVISFSVHMITINVMTRDFETWSGKVSSVQHIPKWIEEYIQVHFTYDSKGNITGSYTTVEHRSHGPNWIVNMDFGTDNKEVETTEVKYNDLLGKFGKEISKPGHRPGYDSGDKNDYWLENINKYLEPVHQSRNFKNMFKASRSVMSFSKIPKDAKVYDYPLNTDLFVSNRLLGLSQFKIDILEWDRLNSELGPIKKVNVILIGYKGGDHNLGVYQEAKWIGGKKNDLVLCYGVDNKDKVVWSYVFGFTERAIVKRNLETILLTNKISNNIIPLIKQEIIKNYELKDWKKFDYLTLTPPLISYFILIIVMIVAQVVYGYFITHNDEDKQN